MKGLYNFLSEESLELHKEYLSTEKLRYSVLEKSIPSVKGADLKTIYRLRIPSKDKTDILKLKRSIDYHEMYFLSFADACMRSDALKEYCRSESDFLYDAYKSSLDERCEFLLLGIDSNKPSFKLVDALSDIGKFIPILAVDMMEHAYFIDYAFRREEYIKNALIHLNLRKFDDFYKNN